MEIMRQFDKITATFNPKRTDDLVRGMKSHIGKRFGFQASWIIEREPYVGEWAMALIEHPMPRDWECAWVPLCDLDNIESVI